MAYYQFNGNTNDSTSNANHGVNNGVILANDRNNNANSAYFFDGDNSYIDVPASTTIQPANAVSVSAWVNTTDKEYWNFAVCKRLNHSSSPGDSYLLASTGFNGAQWQWNISSATTQFTLVSNTFVEENKWLHLIGTYANDTMRLYMNGQEIGMKVVPPGTTIAYSNLSLRLGLGIAITSGAKAAWKGYMDEIRIYNRQLTWDEIRYLYNPATLSANELTVTHPEIGVYPNPSADKIFLDLNTSKDLLDKSEITIIDIAGKEVVKSRYTNGGLDVSSLNAGIYFIKIPAFNSTLKFIKE